MVAGAKMLGLLDATSGLSRIVDRANAGEEIVISKRHVPKSRVIPLEEDGRPLGFFKGHAEGVCCLRQQRRDWILASVTPMLNADV